MTGYEITVVELMREYKENDRKGIKVLLDFTIKNEARMERNNEFFQTSLDK